MSVVAAPPALPMTLRPSVLQWLLLLLCGLVPLVIRYPWSSQGMANWSWTDWLMIAIVGACLLFALVNLVPGASYLRLESQGMVVRSFYRTHTTPWADIAGFGVMTLPRTDRELVGWNYMPGRGKPSFLREFDFAAYGLEVALPDTYGMDAEDLAALLQSIRDRATRSTKAA